VIARVVYNPSNNPFTFYRKGAATVSIQKTSAVNAVGPTSGEFLGNFLDPRDDPSNYPSGLIVLTLTALDNTFQSFSFLVDASLTNTLLPVALDAIKTGYQVLADVDWPQPVVGQDEDGNPINGPAFCHSLWLEFDMKSALQQFVTFKLDVDEFGVLATVLKVPAGKRFAIEQVSGGADLPDGQRLTFYTLGTTLNGAIGVYFFDAANNEKFSTSQQVRIYADPDTDVNVSAHRDSGDGTAEVSMTVSGYLVDFP
jgi:hypothetical protein